MKTQIQKIGFDLDGVLLYNPARIVRPLVAFTKKYFLKRDLDKFYFPKNTFEKIIWAFFHKSSLFKATGVDDIYPLIKKKKLKVYIISARYELLENDFNKWVARIDPEHIYAGYFFNNENEQPQVFKEKMIKRLGLDSYVDDNWDIVKYLSAKTKTKIYWIYNIFDRSINYKNKYASFKKLIKEIEKSV